MFAELGKVIPLLGGALALRSREQLPCFPVQIHQAVNEHKESVNLEEKEFVLNKRVKTDFKLVPNRCSKQ